MKMIHDTFRIENKPLSEAQKLKVKQIKEKAQELFEIIQDQCIAIKTEVTGEIVHIDADVRDISVAKTQLEGAIMWAVKAYTK